MSDFSIRLARTEDAAHLPEIELAAGSLFETVEGLADLARMEPVSADSQRTLIRKGHSLVATSEDRIVGFVTTEPRRRELHIREFSVHPDYQGQGIGSVLLRALGIDAHNSGFSAITLTTFADVPWNAPFYARQGYETVSDLPAHPHLKAEIERDLAHGLSCERRVAMIRFLD